MDDLRGLLDHLEVQRAFLVAQSMGGLTCLGFALAHPERTLGLVLADTTGGIGDPEVVETIRNRKAPKDVTLRAMSAGFRDDDPAGAFLYKEINLLNPPRDPEPNGFTSGEGPKAEDLAGMRVPTLLIVGEEDEVMPPPAMERSPGPDPRLPAGEGPRSRPLGCTSRNPTSSTAWSWTSSRPC